jgi:hypothetical protein
VKGVVACRGVDDADETGRPLSARIHDQLFDGQAVGADAAP